MRVRAEPEPPQSSGLSGMLPSGTGTFATLSVIDTAL